MRFFTREETYELNNTSEVGIEVDNVCSKHRRESERSKAKHKREKVCNSNDYKLSFGRPIQWIMGIVARLRDQNRTFGTRFFDEMMGTKIRHNFRTGENLDMEFLLELTNMLFIVHIENMRRDHDAGNLLRGEKL